MKFVKIGDNHPVNLEQICYFELRKVQIHMYFTTMTARSNWEFDTEADAKAAYDQLVEMAGTVSK